MKLASRDAVRFFNKPDKSKSAVLLYGADAMRVALRRKALIEALTGPNADEEMRLTRLDAALLRKDPAALGDAVKAVGFFPGLRVVQVDSATDTTTKAIKTALEDWQAGDAVIVISAGQLNTRSSLRKLVESGRNSVAIGIYTDPPSREEIEAQLAAKGLQNLPPDTLRDIQTLAHELDPGDFSQTLEKLSLYTLADSSPVTPQDLLACAPASHEAGLDELIRHIAEGRSGEIGPYMARLTSQGTNPTTLTITATRHFRQLHVAAASRQGIEQALGSLRPPVFGPRRDQMARQARNWGMNRLEAALSVLMENDLGLRSSKPVPAMAMTERAFIRISMMRPR
ncbi:MAG: DNA polymerase III subunit delta [Rhodobacteraceae bacterium]|nr:DNA polymerase III subunit delta [Paracoccaceae bacterium]